MPSTYLLSSNIDDTILITHLPSPLATLSSKGSWLLCAFITTFLSFKKHALLLAHEMDCLPIPGFKHPDFAVCMDPSPNQIPMQPENRSLNVLLFLDCGCLLFPGLTKDRIWIKANEDLKLLCVLCTKRTFQSHNNHSLRQIFNIKYYKT